MDFGVGFWRIWNIRYWRYINGDRSKVNRKVVVDIDGVLANFEGAFCETFGYERRELVSLESRYPEHARKIVEFINDPFVYKALKPLQIGLDIIAFLVKKGFDIHVVTGRPFGMEGVTRRWLQQNDIQFDTLTLDTHKTGCIALLKPLVAIDDLFSVHTALLGANVPVIVVAHPWNNYKDENMRRISNLSEFIESFNDVLTNKEKKHA